MKIRDKENEIVSPSTLMKKSLGRFIDVITADAKREIEKDYSLQDFLYLRDKLILIERFREIALRV